MNRTNGVCFLARPKQQDVVASYRSEDNEIYLCRLEIERNSLGAGRWWRAFEVTPGLSPWLAEDQSARSLQDLKGIVRESVFDCLNQTFYTVARKEQVSR